MGAQAEFRLALFAVSFWEYVSKREELSTSVQVRGISCLAWYANSWAGRVVFERLTKHGAHADFRREWPGTLALFGTLQPKWGFFVPSGNSSKQKRKTVAVCYYNGSEKWCRGRDSNPHRNSHYHLKIACLPIPPPRREKRYMQNRDGLQAFFCDPVKFFGSVIVCGCFVSTA